MRSTNVKMSQNKGMIAGVSAGFFWGTPFIAPVILSDFSSFEITFGRFVFFGLISLCNLPRIIKLILKLNVAQMVTLLMLSSAGFWVYTLMLFAGIQLSNGVIASLIMGCMPLTVILFSKPRVNGFLFAGLSLILLGLLSLLLVPLLQQNLSLQNVRASGVILVFLALFTWTWFAIKNSHFMHANPEINSVDYSSLVGLINLAIMIPIFGMLHGMSTLLHHTDLGHFILWSMVLGIGASWIANILWAYCAKNCHAAIGGALVVSETVSGVAYNLIYTQRLPYSNEVIALLCLLCGVIVVIRSQQ